VKKFWTVGVVSVAVAAAAIVVVETTNFAEYLPPRGAVPPASASVSVVARTYLEAAEHEDCGLTRALTDPLSGTEPWCRHPRIVSFRHLETPIFDSDGKASEAVVRFTFTITGGTDAGFAGNDDQLWGLWFTHTSSGWRVCDEGVV
jgi:hypothetical protein